MGLHRPFHGRVRRSAGHRVKRPLVVERHVLLATASRAGRYARSFFGLVDFFAIGPVYLSFLFGVTHSFSVFRSLRLLRVFRILKLTQFVGEAAALRAGLVASLRKIVVFLFVVVTIVTIVGALMYQRESGSPCRRRSSSASAAICRCSSSMRASSGTLTLLTSDP